MLPKNVLLYGKDEPLPERLELRTGPLTMFYENGDLRYIKFGDREVVRRIYVAIRDRNWGTTPPQFSNMQMDIGADSFRIAYDVDNVQGEVDFFWHGEITGTPEGVLCFTMDGVARSNFWRNRIGFCILHPAFLGGSRCVVEHVDGAREEAMLPATISPAQPVQPFAEMSAMTHEVLPGVWAETRYTGDIFEIEDQRNWTDASFKTFCTPLRIPYPVEVQAGTRVSQSVTVMIRDERSGPAASRTSTEEVEPLTFSVGQVGEGRPLPALGLGAASHGQALTAAELERLAALNLGHLRVDLRLSGPDYVQTLERAWLEAKTLGVPLEVALLVPTDGEAKLEGLRRYLDELQPEVVRWLVFPEKELFLGGTPNDEVIELAHRCLDGYRPRADFFAGTNTDFIFMQRSMPPVDQVDGLTFAITAEAHAFDLASIVETLEAQPMVVKTAKALSRGKPVIVSPVTFKMRHNPYATGAWPVIQPGELPPMVEDRQMSLFAAAWTAGSIKALAEAGSSSLTYFETSGWRGIMETAQGSPLPEKFRSIPGSVFPVYHVFSDIGAFAGGRVLPTKTSDNLRVEGIALEKAGHTRVLVTNMTAEPQRVQVCGLSLQVKVRFMDETNVLKAMQSPESFQRQAGIVQATQSGSLAIELLPFAVARIDSH